MEHVTLIAIALIFLGFGLVSRKLSTAVITPPMVFVFAGVMLSAPVLGFLAVEIEQQMLKLLLEVTLVLVLFSDAARINLDKLKQNHIIPQRMLLIGMPLTIVIGTAIASILPSAG